MSNKRKDKAFSLDFRGFDDCEWGTLSISGSNRGLHGSVSWNWRGCSEI
jgi:hypothetical protein